VDHSTSGFITGGQIYYNVFDSLSLKKSQELDEIFNNLNKRGVFNGTVLYSENGKVVFEGAYGYSDFGKRDSLTVHSSFQLASVSKMFTAMAVMILKQQGKLNYDADITQFIPEFPYEGITIRMLLNHRSGLTRYMSLADKYWDINKPINNEQVIDLFVKYKPGSYFRPDDGFHYCNTNYALLASVVERITGETFDVFAKENIFDPLEMNDSFVYNLHSDSVIPYQIPVGVTGYKYGGRYARKMGNYYLNGVMGDKGVYSSVEDMFKFNSALDQAILVSPETISEAFKPGSPAFWKRKDNYGFGWRIKDHADSTAYHFGWWKGFRSFYIRDMKNQKSIVVLTNIGKGFSSEILWDIMEEETTVEELLSIYAHLE
ncbi:MAG: beta-lactamase family protein, partial [Bacteroidales bacterium]|nr:beta-lactamase family protein [Bacteroidales bacterium]